MNAFETFLLDSGFSWTWSKLFPYILFPLLGLIFWLLIRKHLKKRWLRGTVLLLFLAIPFGVYFILYPIYEGDFSNRSEKVALTSELKEGKMRLVVITIPGCPFCMESIGRMKDFKRRNPAANIEYRVCSTDPSALAVYRELSGGAFPVILAENPKQMAATAQSAFPAFVFTNGESGLRWSNDHFGVVALDEVNDRFN
jgi:hypothetical protein